MRTMLVEALGSWVPPTVAGVAAVLLTIGGLAGVIDEGVAVTWIGCALLFLVLFSPFRRYFFSREPWERYPAIAFASLWLVGLATVLHRHDLPGAPMRSGVLHPGEGLSLPAGRRYAILVDGHFKRNEARGNREARYHLALASQGMPPVPLDGAFEDTWARQRLGRRGSTEVEVQHTAVLHRVELPDARTSTLRLESLDDSLEPSLNVAVYPGFPWWLLPAAGLAGLTALLAWEKWRDGDGSAAMAAAVTYFGVYATLNWVAPHPTFRSLIGAMLMGGIIGLPLSALAWWVVPRRWLA
jgi:hypothetical protein